MELLIYQLASPGLFCEGRYNILQNREAAIEAGGQAKFKNASNASGFGSFG